MAYDFHDSDAASFGLEQAAARLVRAAFLSALRDPLVLKEIRKAVRDEIGVPEKRTATGLAFDGETVTVQQAAKFANVTDGTIRDWISKGKLTSLRAGNRHRILRDDLLRCMADKETREVISFEAEAARIVALDHKKTKAKGG